MTRVRQSAALVAAAFCGPLLAGGFDPWTQSAHYELEYRVDLTPLVVRPADSIRVWVPTPAANAHQQVLSTNIKSPWTHRETQDRYGNRYIYLEAAGKETAKGGALVMHFVVERSPSKGVRQSSVRPDTALDPRRYLAAQRRVPIGGLIRQIAERESSSRETDAQKIRAFYDYVTRTMRYSKHGQGWGRGDALWACDARYGNCTDFHSVFVGLARSQKIPARFIIGFPIPADKTAGEIGGYHCWTEAYDRQRGWVPLDASEAWKTKRLDDYFGTLPSDRVAFTVGRDLVLEPPQQGEPLNYFIYPYAEVDGQPVERVPWKLRFRRLAAPKAGD